MPFKDKAQQTAYQLRWLYQRRTEWFAANGPCRCGSWDRLELDHIDPAQKVSHNVWSWSEARRAAELAKCQPLCYDCHKKKTREQVMTQEHGTYGMYNQGCRCDACVAKKKLGRDSSRLRLWGSLSSKPPESFTRTTTTPAA